MRYLGLRVVPVTAVSAQGSGRRPVYAQGVSAASLTLGIVGAATGLIGAGIAWFAYRRAGEAVEAATRSAAASERSASASERSADTAESTAHVAREDFEMRRRQVAAQLALEVHKANGGTASFSLRNVGGSVATRVAPQQILINGDAYFGVSGVAESIAPGDAAEFVGHGPALAHDAQRAVIEDLSYTDGLGHHDAPDEPLRWQRTT